MTDREKQLKRIAKMLLRALKKEHAWMIEDTVNVDGCKACDLINRASKLLGEK